MKLSLPRALLGAPVILSGAERSRRTCVCFCGKGGKQRTSTGHLMEGRGSCSCFNKDECGPMKGSGFGRKGTGFNLYIYLPKTEQALAAEGKVLRGCSRLILFIVGLATLSCAAQTTPLNQPNTQDQPHQGQVIFSRSTDENGQTTTQTAPSVQQTAAAGALPPPQVPAAGEPAAPQVAFTAFDLDVHLRPAAQQIAVRARLTLRNDGKAPLTRIPLQISSSLNWERIRLGAANSPMKDAACESAVCASNASSFEFVLTCCSTAENDASCDTNCVGSEGLVGSWFCNCATSSCRKLL